MQIFTKKKETTFRFGYRVTRCVPSCCRSSQSRRNTRLTIRGGHSWEMLSAHTISTNTDRKATSSLLLSRAARFQETGESYKIISPKEFVSSLTFYSFFCNFHPRAAASLICIYLIVANVTEKLTMWLSIINNKITIIHLFKTDWK